MLSHAAAKGIRKCTHILNVCEVVCALCRETILHFCCWLNEISKVIYYVLGQRHIFFPPPFFMCFCLLEGECSPHRFTATLTICTAKKRGHASRRRIGPGVCTKKKTQRQVRGSGGRCWDAAGEEEERETRVSLRRLRKHHPDIVSCWLQ